LCGRPTKTENHPLKTKDAPIQRLKSQIDRVVGAVLVALMAVSVVNVLWQVFTRFIMGAPSSFTTELARFLLIWIGVLGAGYVVGQKDHLALELLPEQLEGRQAVRLELFIQACVVAFALAVMVWGGTRLVYVQLALGQTSPTLGVRLGLVYLVVPISGLLMTFYAALHLSNAWRGRSSDEATDAGEEKVLPID
jgi:TRAP-type C4-dicarboxylate transport system permease small subunit